MADTVAARTTLFSYLVDDAALFPPARDPMDVAVSGHLQRCQFPYQWIMGRFLSPGTRIGELRASLNHETTVELGLILRESAETSALDLVADDPNLHLTGIELGPQFGEMESVLQVRNVAIYQEVDREGRLEPQLDRIADLGVAAKLRTGGPSSAAFPPVEVVASFIEGCIERGIGFKCTAGLHHVVPYTDPATRFEHHGFLNIILATHEVISGCDPIATLTIREGPLLAEKAAALTPEQAATLRTSYHGHGSCVVSEAAADLAELGLI